jgi:hypothetical protein
MFGEIARDVQADADQRAVVDVPDPVSARRGSFQSGRGKWQV